MGHNSSEGFPGYRKKKTEDLAQQLSNIIY